MNATRMKATPITTTPSSPMVATARIEESLLYASLVLGFIDHDFPAKQAEALAYVESRSVLNA